MDSIRVPDEPKHSLAKDHGPAARILHRAPGVGVGLLEPATELSLVSRELEKDRMVGLSGAWLSGHA